MSDFEEKRVVVKRSGNIGFDRFLREVVDNLKEGWELAPPGDRRTQAKQFPFTCFLVKGEAVQAPSSETGSDATPEPESPSEGSTDAPEEAITLESLTGKQDLLDYAKGKEIEVPSNLKQPAAIKKFLQEAESGADK